MHMHVCTYVRVVRVPVAQTTPISPFDHPDHTTGEISPDHPKIVPFYVIITGQHKPPNCPTGQERSRHYGYSGRKDRRNARVTRG